jgi:hypothetical protein
MKKLIVFFITCSLFFSCTKTDECGKKCVDIRIRGRVRNMEGNVGIPNIPVTVAWNSYKTWFGSADVISITKVNTDKSGDYDFVVAIDSSLFTHNYIQVDIPLDSNFINYDCSTRTDVLAYRIVDLYSSYFSFRLFPITVLTLKVIHPANSTLLGGAIGHSHGTDFGSNYGDYSWQKRGVLKDSLIKIKTNSVEFTTLNWSKLVDPGKSTNHRDSILCKKNAQNVFEITF